MSRTVEWALVVVAVIGALPYVVAVIQLLIVGGHRYRSHLDRSAPYFPRTAILVPAWNEAPVLRDTIERLVALEYPIDRLRIVVVDDASTDDTPAVLAAMIERYPDTVVHLRREHGGQGKAHTLNHGLAHVLADDWAEAVLIMDADVVFTPPSLRRLTRHLADPEVGAVTGYIKEGSGDKNGIRLTIAFEYTVAQAIARRAQNVGGALACLAGGAQLHSRANLEAIGGAIDTSTLAEDTVTTFLTQLGGRKVVFDPNAVVWAEEPDTVDGVWKQRLRWARGNVQVTRRFHRVFFRPSPTHRLGGLLFGLWWYTLMALPILMITSSAALVGLWAMESSLEKDAFRWLWIANGLSFLFLLVFTWLVDPEIGWRAWLRGIMFPGLVSALIIVGSVFPPVNDGLRDTFSDVTGVSITDGIERAVALAAYLWVSLCMVAAYLVWRVDRAGHHRLAGALLWIVGYGPLQCAITFTGFVKEARHAELVWDKTVKSGGVAARS
ncbi:glycosyltransferase [Desertimonas flava]|uniref:glycosyltransferase n=1 Tax=Desertimonas flava TaxID=2064846 RepID=UPI000E34C96E|nr:glycosyltransferase family 2 protein [Desertimonas flava]